MLAFDDLRVGLRLGLQLGGEPGDQRAGSGRSRRPRRSVRAARKRIFTALLLRQRLFEPRRPHGPAVRAETRVGQRRELRGRPVGVLGRQVRGSALLENAHGVGETAFDAGQIAETGRGERSAQRVERRQRLVGARSPAAAGPVRAGRTRAQAGRRTRPARASLAPPAPRSGNRRRSSRTAPD